MKILILLSLLLSFSACKSSGGNSTGASSTTTAPPPITILESVHSANILRNESKVFSLGSESFDSYQIESSPSKGAVIGTFPNITYVPNLNVSGSDSFRYILTLGSVQRRLIFNINISIQNTAPVVSDITVFVQRGNSISLPLAGSDVDNDQLTYEIVQQPDTGTIRAMSYSTFGYDAPNSILTTIFYYKAYDGKSYSNIAKGTINVTRLNQNPVITTLSEFSLLEDNSVLVNLTATDTDGDEISFSVKTQPQHGVISGTIPNLVYTPYLNYNGVDSIVIEASDPIGGKSSKIISFSIAPVADAPILLDLDISVAFHDTVILPLEALDPDGDNLTYTIVQDPTKGFINVVGNKIIYNHYGYIGGSDLLKIRVSDGIMLSDIATVNIHIIAPDLEPIANDISVELASNSVKNITLSGMIYTTEPVYTIVDQPIHGTVTGNPPNVTYTPNNNITVDTLDRFSYKITENGKTSNIAIVNINLKGGFNYFAFDGNTMYFSNIANDIPDLMNLDGVSVKSQTPLFLFGSNSSNLNCSLDNSPYYFMNLSSTDEDNYRMYIDDEYYSCLNNITVKKDNSETLFEKVYDLGHFVFMEKFSFGESEIYFGHKGDAYNSVEDEYSTPTPAINYMNGMNYRRLDFTEKNFQDAVVGETELIKKIGSDQYVRIVGDKYNLIYRVPDSNPVEFVLNENLLLYSKMDVTRYPIVLIGFYYMKDGVMTLLNDVNNGLDANTLTGSLIISGDVSILKLNKEIKGFKDTYTNESGESVSNIGNDYKELIKLLIVTPN